MPSCLRETEGNAPKLDDTGLGLSIERATSRESSNSGIPIIRRGKVKVSGIFILEPGLISIPIG